jgi:hypothetical protein
VWHRTKKTNRILHCSIVMQKQSPRAAEPFKVSAMYAVDLKKRQLRELRHNFDNLRSATDNTKPCGAAIGREAAVPG